MAYIIAMSGGVDSSVAAYLLQQEGLDIKGVTMRLIRNEDREKVSPRKCCSDKDINDARMVAGRLNIPFDVYDYCEDFRDFIIEKFICDYEEGRTPNPCIECNRYMKFERLLNDALKEGFEGVATGHYARISFDEKNGRYLLKKASDPSKDQSYVLYMLTQDELAHIRFPLGELKKEETRKIAESIGFVNASKPDSQDICFVPDGDYLGFIERFKGEKYEPGNIIDTDGNVLGKHNGAVGYTLGQRKGLGLAMGEPVYVCDKDMQANTVTVGSEDHLFKTEVFVSDMNWISIPNLTEPMKIAAKLRYRQKESPAVMYPCEDGIKLIFDKPQRAPAPGQAAVIYDGDVVVGGGTIC